MSDAHYEATYLIETPLPLEKVAEVMAGEQSCGTFTRVEGETDELRARARATVVSIHDKGEVEGAVRSAWLDRKGYPTKSRQGEIVVRFPVANVGVNLPTLAATKMVGGAASITDLAILRHGAMRTVFDRPYAPSTLRARPLLRCGGQRLAYPDHRGRPGSR